MTLRALDIDALLPDPEESQTAERLTKVLGHQFALGEPLLMVLSGGESGAQEALPVTAAKLLVKILSEIAIGNAIAVVSMKPELTETWS